MKTLDGKKMSRRYATEPVGSVLRIAPAFVVTYVDDEAGVETAIEVRYVRARGEYVITAIANRAIRDDFADEALRRTFPLAILQAAIPHCISLRLDSGAKERWVTLAELTTAEGRIIPEWMARAVVKRGMKDERMEVIELLYGAAALSKKHPTKAVQVELDVPHRTASDWIGKARAAGRLEGMSYTPGRQADA